MMRTEIRRFVTAAALLAAFSAPTSAVVIDFTGGTVQRQDGTTETTNNSVIWDNVDYYDEGGFRLDFMPNGAGTAGFATSIGDYYTAGNDVIHAHWATGNFGGVTSIDITQIGGGTFDLNYFILTSNTDTGGGAASGNEMAYIEAWVGGALQYRQLLPTEDWGFPATQIFLGSQFDSVDLVRFVADNTIDCFGMDEFFINEPAPGVPLPGALALFGIGLVGLGYARKFRRN